MLEEVLKIRIAVILILLCLGTVVGCATIPNDLRPEQMIFAADCDQVSVSPSASPFSVATVEQISRLYRCEELAYVGSDENHHFFYWYVKMAAYHDQPSGFAVVRSSYEPVEKFGVGENKIGEHPFPVSE